MSIKFLRLLLFKNKAQESKEDRVATQKLQKTNKSMKPEESSFDMVGNVFTVHHLGSGSMSELKESIGKQLSPVNTKKIFDFILNCFHLNAANVNRKSGLTVVLESQYIDKDYRNTFSYYHSKRFVTPPSRCLRLHFFDHEINEESIDICSPNINLLQKSYLGYTVIRPTEPMPIGRTLLKCEYFLSSNPNCYCLACKETVYIRGIALRVKGFPFISQDYDATTCAESSIWMILRYFSNRYCIYGEKYPFFITQQKAEFSHGSRIYPSDGLSVFQVAECLRLNGFSPLVYRKKDKENNIGYDTNEFRKYMYAYIESGIPLILATSRGRHAIVAIGHSSDFSLNIGRNNKQHSSDYMTALIINDDTQHPYQAISILDKHKHGSKRESKIAIDEISVFIVPLAERIFMSAEEAISIFDMVLYKDFTTQIGLKKTELRNQITRTFLTTGRDWKEAIYKRKMSNTVKYLYANAPLPHFIWVCEISTIEQYRNGKVVGEIILDPTRNKHEMSAVLAIHSPRQMYFDFVSSFNGLHDADVIKYQIDDEPPYDCFQENLTSQWHSTEVHMAN